MIKESTVAIAQTLKRHLDFWNKNTTDRPLLGFHLRKKVNARQIYGFPLGPLTPDKLDPELFVTAYEEGVKQGGLFDGDLFNVASAGQLPFAKGAGGLIPWAEAIAGCQIEVLQDAVWAKEPLDMHDQLNSAGSLENNPWLSKALEITRVLNQRFAGSYPTAPPNLRGPADMLAALLGTEKMCLDMIDDPDKIKSITHRCTDIWFEVCARLRNVATKFHNGYCDPRFQLWAPDYTLASQEDCAIYFSPVRYNELLLGSNRRIFSFSPFTVMHVHSQATHTIDPLLSLKGLGAMQINVDTNGPTVSEMIPIFAKVQKEKPLILVRSFSKQELEELLEYLRPEALCLIARPDTPQETIEFMQKIIEEGK